MKICSVCRQCYDDSVTHCSADDNGSLVQARDGNRRLVEGCELDLRVEPDSPCELYTATHLDSGKSVSIRFIKTDVSGDDLLKEIEAVAAINHPNVARVYEFGKVSDDEIFVVSEEIAGQNLRLFLEKNSPLKERHAIKIARQIAEGLEELHKQNLIHRAVSPANIYFTNSDNNDFEVKLQNYDFGAVVQKKVVKGANGIDAKTEIFRYFSPEQFSGEKVDFKSDIYSLAVVFYEMLLGHSPYNALNPQAISNYVFNESDTEKLHFDLRALLAYTLHQSLQHKLHLRPPTTNNLARQYRHLELVAAPPEIGLQQAKTNQPKQRKNISSYQADKPKIIEIKSVEEIKISEPELQAEDQPIAQPAEKKSETSEAEIISKPETIEKKSEPVLIPSELPPTEIRNSVVEENIIEAEKAEEIEFSEISEEQFELIDENISFEDEVSAEDIHITNRDFVEESEPEIYFSEPEFVEESAEKESPADRHIMNSFGAYSQPKSFQINKIYALTAGVLAIIIFGVFIAARISNTQNNETSVSKNPSAIPANLHTKETKVETEEHLTNEQNPNRKEIEPSKSNEKIIQTDYSDDVPKNESKKLSPSNAGKKTAVQTFKKPTKNEGNESVVKKSDTEKAKPATNSAAGMTRPRIVTNVKTND